MDSKKIVRLYIFFPQLLAEGIAKILQRNFVEYINPKYPWEHTKNKEIA